MFPKSGKIFEINSILYKKPSYSRSLESMLLKPLINVYESVGAFPFVSVRNRGTDPKPRLTCAVPRHYSTYVALQGSRCGLRPLTGSARLPDMLGVGWALCSPRAKRHLMCAGRGHTMCAPGTALGHLPRPKDKM